MSHFTVMVVGRDPTAQLQPFQENNMGDCPAEYMEFEDKEDELKHEYETGTATMRRLADGSLHHPGDKQFVKEGARPFDREFVYPADSVEVDVPFTDVFKTFESFAHSYHGYTKRDEKMGRYGYWENPQAKWDWYQLGGRWTGFWRLKAGRHGITGTPGVMTDPSTDSSRADAALKRDIDFDHMRNAAGLAARNRWRKINMIIAGREFATWDATLEKYGKEKIQTARDEYHNQQVVKDLSKTLGFYEKAEDFIGSEDDYVQEARDSAIVTHAVLMDGKWYENGTMGWWGIVANEKGRDVWAAEFSKLLDSLPGDTLLSIYDCHI